MQIDGKVVLITGASEGIGAACAREFRKRGARVSLTARSEDKLKDVGGADSVVLNQQGFSNAVLITPPGGTPPVPEPATWAMMLVGLGIVGGAIRYRRRTTTTTYA